MNSRKRRLVIPINIGVTRSDRMKTNLGKASAIFNWHQPPGADYPYVGMEDISEVKETHNLTNFGALYLTQFLTDFSQILDSKSYDQA